MKKRIKHIAIIFLFFSINSFSQTIKYEFVINFIDTSSTSFKMKSFEKNSKVGIGYKRRYHSKNEFKETFPILNNKLTYKIIDGKWCFKQDGRWELFFDNGHDIDSYINFDWYKNKLKPGEMDHIRLNWVGTNLVDSLLNEKIYMLILEVGEKSEIYFFTKTDGIIGKKTDYGYIVRNDKKYLKLYKLEYPYLE